ncbi:LysM peptidoglycan-binding domain-containing protein [Thalassotalea aquiviva]|uniref:LysM peptidoglycan-binding domain-containing protein n=1 Tax=Thalassotalea aquiviva TaxID=3242415 RepID=UPI00352A80F4
MIKRILITIICFSTTLLAYADELRLKQDAPKTYIVQKGDTLWDISEIFLNEPWLWPKLWRLNPEIDNPHLIFPGDVLRLVYDANGLPMLVKGKPNITWTPQKRKTLKDENPVTLLPLDRLAPYLNYSQILSEKVFDQAPIILGADEAFKTNIEDAKLYVNSNLTPGKRYAIYAKGDEVIDPQTGDELGYNAILVGTATSIRAGDIENSEPATMYLDTSRREIRAGNIVLPVNEQQLLPSVFAMQVASDDEFDARIISSYNNAREFTKYEVVLLNKGSADQVNIGAIYSVKRQSPAIVGTSKGPAYKEDASWWYRLTNFMRENNGIEMPYEDVGKVMVFKVQERTSFAIVLSTDHTISIKDKVTTL